MSSKKVKVQRPAHVPEELMPVWTAAAKYIASRKKLVVKARTASGAVKARINYSAVNGAYRRILAKYVELAEIAEE